MNRMLLPSGSFRKNRVPPKEHYLVSPGRKRAFGQLTVVFRGVICRNPVQTAGPQDQLKGIEGLPGFQLGLRAWPLAGLPIKRTLALHYQDYFSPAYGQPGPDPERFSAG